MSEVRFRLCRTGCPTGKEVRKVTLRVHIHVVDEDSDSPLNPLDFAFNAATGDGVGSVSGPAHDVLDEVRQVLRSAWEECDDMLVNVMVQQGRYEVLKDLTEAHSSDETNVGG